MSGLGPQPEGRRNVWLWVTVAICLLGIAAVLVGVLMVGGLGWMLIVAGAAAVALALTVVPT